MLARFWNNKHTYKPMKTEFFLRKFLMQFQTIAYLLVWLIREHSQSKIGNSFAKESIFVSHTFTWFLLKRGIRENQIYSMPLGLRVGLLGLLDISLSFLLRFPSSFST